MPDQRSTLLLALATLALVQFAHLRDVLRYADEAKFPSVLADPLAIVGITAATGAFVAVARRWRHARDIAIAAGGSVAVSFTLYHGIPIDLGVNNPYWGPDGRADLIRWLTLLAAIEAGAWSAWLAAKDQSSPLTDRPTARSGSVRRGERLAAPILQSPTARELASRQSVRRAPVDESRSTRVTSPMMRTVSSPLGSPNDHV